MCGFVETSLLKTSMNDTEKPLISIITVVLNGAKTVEQTIQSVLQQDYPRKEYIIIDGGSTDGTLDIIRKYEDRIDYWISVPDKGIFDAMNKGIRMAKGELIGIINADDWYEKNILKLVSEAYINSDKGAVIHGLLRNFEDEQFYSIKGNSTRVLRYDMIQHPTCFIPKMLYEKYGYYDEKYRYCADYDLILRFVNRNVPFEFLEKIIANFRIGGVSLKGKAQVEKYQILRKHKIISGNEAFLRILGIGLAHWTKKVIHK